MATTVRPTVLIVALLCALCHSRMVHTEVPSTTEMPYAPWNRDHDGCITFMSIGDQGTPTDMAHTVAASMAKECRRIAAERPQCKCSFVLGLGDYFYRDGIAGDSSDAMFRTHFEEVFNVAPLNGLPWVVVLGNHDIRGNVTAIVDYGNRNTLWYMPAPVYSFRLSVDSSTEALFVALNSYGGNLKEQLDYASKEFAQADTTENSPVKWKFLVNHNPLLSGGHMHGHSLDDVRIGDRNYNARSTTHRLSSLAVPMVHDRHVHGVFSGDDHNLQILSDNSTTYYVNGGGGGAKLQDVYQTEHTQFYRKSNGFMSHTLTKDTLQTTVFDSTGEALYTHVMHNTPVPTLHAHVS